MDWLDNQQVSCEVCLVWAMGRWAAHTLCTCDKLGKRDAMRGYVPCQAQANNLQLSVWQMLQAGSRSCSWGCWSFVLMQSG